MSATKQTTEKVRDLIDGVIAREGFELLDVQMVAEPGRAILRLFIDTVPPGDKERGIGVDDCATVSRVVGDLLDVEDAIEGEYHLEVSSPGIFRPLTKPEHFERSIGERVKVRTYEKIEGRKVFIGSLKKVDESELTIEIDGKPFSIAAASVAKANLEPLL